MASSSEITGAPVSSIPRDDPGRKLTIPGSDGQNAPHQFHNQSNRPARLLCICAPSGQENLFAEVGVPVASRTPAPPKLDEKAQAAFMAKVLALAPKYKTELLSPA